MDLSKVPATSGSEGANGGLRFQTRYGRFTGDVSIVPCIKPGETGFAMPVREMLPYQNEPDFECGMSRWTKRICSGHLAGGSNRGISSRGIRTAPVGTILVFRIGQLGDTLVAMPAIQAISKKFPKHRLVLLTNRCPAGEGFVSSWDVLGPTGWFDDVVFYTPPKSLLDKFECMCTLALTLRKFHPEYIADLSPVRSKFQKLRDRMFFQKLVRIPHYLSDGAFAIPDRRSDGGLPRLEPEWRRLLNIVGGVRDCSFRLRVPEREKIEVGRVFCAEGIDQARRLLAISPGSKMLSKRWPIERYEELGTRLLDRIPDAGLVVLGGAEDAAIGYQLCRQWGTRAWNLAGKLSIYGSAAAMDRCVAYVGNDTGAMHLAAMVGIPCVVLFSARDYPGRWEPYGEGHSILRHEIECARCMLEMCTEKGNDCIKRISVDEAFASVTKVMSTRTERQSGH